MLNSSLLTLESKDAVTIFNIPFLSTTLVICLFNLFYPSLGVGMLEIMGRINKCVLTVNTD
jgi:hypothetical protein